MNKNSLAGCLMASAMTLGSPAAALELEAGATHENLSRGGADWQNIYLEAEHQLGERQVVYAALRHSERIDQQDTD